MGTEVDSLEVKVEASAKSANASLTNLAKRLGTVSQQLQSVCSYQPTIKALTGNLNSISRLDFKNVKDLKNAIKTMSKDMAKINGRQIKISVNKLGDIENAAKKVTDLSEKVAEASKSIKISVDSSEVNSAKKACDELKKKTSGLKASAQTIKKASGQLGASDGKSVLSGAETRQRFSSIVQDKDKGIAEEETKEASKFSKILSGTQKVSKSLSNTFGKMGKTVGGVVSKAKDLKNLITRTNKSGGQMSMGRMLGMSLVFSTVFSALSAINNAIKEGSNNLVQYSSDYNKSISGIVTSLLYLKNAWAAAFAPIINVVGPYISAFIDMLANAMNKVAQFMAVLTGKTAVVQAKKAWKDYGKTLTSTGSSAKKAGSDAAKAAKDLENYTLGIDELNVIQPTTSSSSGGSDGSSGAYTGPDVSEMFETTEPNKAISDYAKRLREAFKAQDWTSLGSIMAEGVNAGMQKLYDIFDWNKHGEKITYFCNAFTTTMNSLVDNIEWPLMGATVAAGVNTVFNTAQLLITGFNWTNLGTGIGTAISTGIQNIDWGTIGYTLGAYFMISWNTLVGILRELKGEDIGMALANAFNGALDSINLGTIGESIGRMVALVI